MSQGDRKFPTQYRARIAMLTFMSPLLASAQSLMPVASTAVPEPDAIISPARSRASVLFRALTGVQIPIDDQRLKQMELSIAKNDMRAAVKVATADPLFYDIRVRDLAKKMSTRAQTITAPLSDFVATFVGVVRDSDTTPAKLLLTGNFTYQANPALIPVATVPNDDNSVWNSNAHYLAIANGGYSLPAVLRRVDGQRVYTGNTPATADLETTMPTVSAATIAHPDPAGLLTTRGWQEAHAVAGTNRRLVEFTFSQFMCQPIMNWHDITVSDQYVGRDVDRAPGQDQRKFQETCRGCHGPMDAMRPAFAKVDFLPNANNAAQGKPIYNMTGVVPKFSRNKNTNVEFYKAVYGVNAPFGFQVTNNNWNNLLTSVNGEKMFGWRSTNSGAGMSQFAEMVANSRQFSRCLVQRVFAAICKRDPVTSETALVQKLADDFEADRYHLRNLFESVAMRPECVSL